jgi:hypothetical protein
MAKECCVVCGIETPYDYDTHIDLRIGYEEGLGQLCYKHWANKSNNQEIIIPEELIYNTPNDNDLGSKVREIYNKKIL